MIIPDCTLFLQNKEAHVLMYKYSYVVHHCLRRVDFRLFWQYLKVMANGWGVKYMYLNPNPNKSFNM